MSWKLWLDDLCRTPGSGRETPTDSEYRGEMNDRLRWHGHASVQEVIDGIDQYCLPCFMSLDYDLGKNETTMDFLKEWTKRFPDTPFPPYQIHSANPVGAKNIQSFIESWNKSLKVQ